MTKLVLFTGFLGSGKTTLIRNLIQTAQSEGKTVACIANDQGSILVDSAFFQQVESNSFSVTGGCFCCNMNNLIDTIRTISKSSEPDYIFAEAVGSCTDITATVINPLLSLFSDLVEICGFFTLVDSYRLSGEYLSLNLEQPLSPQEVLLEHQLKEAGVILLTKVDLVSSDQLTKATHRLQALLPNTPMYPGDSRDLTYAQLIFKGIESGSYPLATQVIPIDYEIYTRAEQELAWADWSGIVFDSQDGIVEKATDLLTQLDRELEGRLVHGKVFLFGKDFNLKLSSVSGRMSIDGSWSLQSNEPCKVQVLCNLRAQIEPERLVDLVEQYGQALGIKEPRGFIPGVPKPTYHMQPKM